MKKLFLKNIIEDNESINKLSRETLLKLLNLLPKYLDKNITDIIDKEIELLNNTHHIEISNIRINDIKAEMFKKKYKKILDLIDFKIYEYEHYKDLYFSGKEINCDLLVEKIKENINKSNFKAIHMTSRTIRTPYIFKSNNEENDLWDSLKLKLKKIKNIETVKLRFYTDSEPEIIKKTIKKKKNKISH